MAEDPAVAPAGLKLRELHSGRAAAQPGHRHAHVAVDERRDAREIALDAPRQSWRMLLATRTAVSGCAPASSAPGREATPQVPEGGEAEARPQRQQRGLNRPAAVVASEQHGRSERRRQLAGDRSPHQWALHQWALHLGVGGPTARTGPRRINTAQWPPDNACHENNIRKQPHIAHTT